MSENELTDARLEVIRERVESDLVLHPWDFGPELVNVENMASELLEEVDRLRKVENVLTGEVNKLWGRLEAVEKLVLDEISVGEDVSALKILEAVRGE